MKISFAGFVVLVAAIAMVKSASEVELTSEPHHHLALVNKYVRVFKVEVAPHESTLMHWHRHDYVFFSLGPAEVSNEVAGKAPVTLRVNDGQGAFLEGNFAHIARNLGDTSFRNLTIEFLQDAKYRESPPPKWDEERGLDVLNGGTREIMFVHDGVRASKIELQAGAVFPKHTHPGPYLLIALTDLNLRNENGGRGSQTVKLNVGDFDWTEHPITHTVTNTGKQEAKFIVLEFPK